MASRRSSLSVRAAGAGPPVAVREHADERMLNWMIVYSARTDDPVN